MNLYREKLGIIASVFLYVTLFSGCLEYSNITPTVTTHVESVSTSTPFLTSSSEPASTWTPSTKLSKEEAVKTIQEMINTNNHCNFPCYLGIYPGKTTRQEMFQKFSPLGEINDTSDSATSPETTPYLICIPFCTSNKPFIGFFPVFWVKDDIVIGISPDKTYLDEEFKNSISRSLNIFGKPDEVWVLLIEDELSNQKYYDIKLLYQSRGIILSLSGDVEVQSDFSRICPQIDNGIPNSIFLFDVSKKIKFPEFETKFLGDSIGWNTQEYQLIDQITNNFTSEKFFEIYSQENIKECIDVFP